MSLDRIILILLLLSCAQPSSNENDQDYRIYLSNLFLQTSYFPCSKNQFDNTINFEDEKGDTRVGFLQQTPTNLDIQDLFGGSISNSADLLDLELQFGNIPDVVNVNLPSVDSTQVDLQISYTFYKPEEVSIGIFHYSNGVKEPKRWNQFNIQVFEGNLSIGTCGLPIVTKTTIRFFCEKSLFPILNPLNTSTLFNVNVVYRDANITYKDCY
jgi:hypothetical protein